MDAILQFTENEKLLKLQQYSDIGFEQLKLLLREKGYNRRKKSKYVRDELIQHHHEYYMHAGFWHDILSAKKKYNVSMVIRNIKSDFIHSSINDEQFESWLDTLVLPFEPYNYQIKACFNAIKYRICRSELDTGAGKTLFCYMVARFMLDHGLFGDTHKQFDFPELARYKIGKLLIVVPTPDLVRQTANEFTNEFCSDSKIICDTIFSGGKKFEASNVVIGNIDSLVNYEPEYFEQFNGVIFDEAHKIQTETYRRVAAFLSNNRMFTFHGCSGTFNERESVEGLRAEALLGPILIKKQSWELIAEGKLTAVNVIQYELQHTDEISMLYYDDPNIMNLNKRFMLETSVINKSTEKLRFIAHLVQNVYLNGNWIFLARRKKYIKIAAAYLKLIFPDKIVRTIIGSDSSNSRDATKTLMENDSNVLVVANYKCIDTGISIKNLHYICLLESVKSWISLRQSIGRGLRLHPSKKVFLVIDLIDKLINTTMEQDVPKSNARLTHGSMRRSIYKARKIPYVTKKIDLNKFKRQTHV